jgi:hypothetical protein
MNEVYDTILGFNTKETSHCFRDQYGLGIANMILVHEARDKHVYEKEMDKDNTRMPSFGTWSRDAELASE